MFPTSLNSHHLAAVSATLRISPYGARWALRAGRYFRRSIYRQPGKGTYIKLYYAHLAEPNAHLPLGEGELWGCVIAHGVGHLLLGTDSHSHEGIMQGHWEDPQLREAGKGNLQFTPSQAGLMREHLAAEQKKKESR
jgi:hypothetical protein